jgi:hypothetical protein
MKRCLIAGLLVVVVAVSLPVPQASHAGKPSRQRVRFVPLHVYLDPGDRPLAAYQFELAGREPARASSSEEDNALRRRYEPRIRIVGVEGGTHRAFNDAPYYDPAALQNDRIIIAAFNTGDDLPTGRTRVATLHLQVLGDAEPEYELDLVTAADANGSEIPVEITFETGERK